MTVPFIRRGIRGRELIDDTHTHCHNLTASKVLVLDGGRRPAVHEFSPSFSPRFFEILALKTEDTLPRGPRTRDCRINYTMTCEVPTRLIRWNVK
jgi:hypothetical protein